MYGQPVVTSQPVVLVQAPCGETPMRTTCPACQQQIVTSTHPTPGLLTWLLFGGFILFGCWLGCCLIPFFVDSLQDVNHFCPNCNYLVGRHKRLWSANRHQQADVTSKRYLIEYAVNLASLPALREHRLLIGPSRGSWWKEASRIFFCVLNVCSLE